MVLLLDDDESFRSGLAENLRDDGYDVSEYAGVDDLPPVASLGEVGVLVTDYDMPGTNGLAFADRFHAAHPEIPIIMVTGQWTRAVEAQASAREFVQLLRKPLVYDDLHAVLETLIGPKAGDVKACGG